jgi:hypothetical protein
VTGRVVDDQEDLAALVARHELPQELEEGDPVAERSGPGLSSGIAPRSSAADGRLARGARA